MRAVWRGGGVIEVLSRVREACGAGGTGDLPQVRRAGTWGEVLRELRDEVGRLGLRGAAPATCTLAFYLLATGAGPEGWDCDSGGGALQTRGQVGAEVLEGLDSN